MYRRLYGIAVMKNLLAPLTALLMLGGAFAISGCELISSVDRSKIDGSGGAGGGGTATSTSTAGACSAAADCPGADTECSKRTCDAGVCGVDLVAKGTPTSAQTAGDCKASVCDGAGMTTSQDDDTDILDDGNDCTDDTCSAGAPKNTPKAAEAACASGGGKVCDGNGACVECAAASDCATGVCQANKCAPATCADTVKNGAETDVDCGGGSCGPCADGLACAAASDCQSGVCTGGVCIQSGCEDKVKNGAETDVDCGGGACPACGPTLGCKGDSDCTGGSCSGSVCVPTCTDKVKNGAETDVDCGGGTCGKCVDGNTCTASGDCASNVCTAGTCQIPACNDLSKNGNETDVDCGGSCAPCGATLQCAGPADCASGVCTGGVCQAPSCTDLVKNGGESDVDCGGATTCGKCAPNQICSAGTDCTSGICTGGLCAAPSCGDGVVNGVDACDDGNATAGDGCTACAVDLGYTCTGTAPSVCATTCGDGIKAGAEACDDGNTVATDGCDASCAVSVGFTCAGTQPSVCTATCGDGIMAGAEGCDDGNTAPGDGCNALCAVESGYACTGAPSVCATVCGDGVLSAGEQCDDGNTANGDCCSSTCQIEAGCEIEPNDSLAKANSFSALQVTSKINGYIKPAGEKDYFSFVVPTGTKGTVTTTTIDSFLGVTCASSQIDTFMTFYDSAMTSLGTNDDIAGAANRCSSLTVGNLAAGTYYLELKAYSNTATFGYTLQATVALSICGNNIVEVGEQCDGTPDCAADCTLLPVCGNNLVEVGEQCDDGNTTPGDGCSAACALETVAEIEPNDTTAQADTNAATLLINGTLSVAGSFSAATDVDVFAVSVAAESTVRFEIFDAGGHDCVSMPTSTLTLLDSTGAEITNDMPGGTVASGIDSCAALVYDLAPGTYYIQLGADAAAAYIFQAKLEADDGTEIEPNDDQASASAFPGRDAVILGDIVGSDADWYAITLPATLSIRAEILEGAAGAANTCESFNLDSYLDLVDSTGSFLVSNDDDGRGFCSAIDGTGSVPRDAEAHNLAAGTYYVQVTGFTDFAYRLAVTVR